MLGGSNLKNFLLGGTRRRELAATREAWERAQVAWRASPLARKSLCDLAIEVVQSSVRLAERRPTLGLLVVVTEAVEGLLGAEGIGDITPLWDLIDSDVAVAIEFRCMVVRRQRWASDFDQMFGAFSRIVVEGLVGFYATLPESCFGITDPKRGDTFDVPVIDLLDDPVTTVDRLFMLPYANDSFRLDVFNQLREVCATNLLVASGFRPDTNIRQVEDKLVRPTAHKRKTGAELTTLYLNGSPLRPLLEMPVPFHIPDEQRFEHCHIVGGTGHGKTQLMQKMIHADLIAAQEDGRSIIVIDSQGDLINKLMRLELFLPGAPGGLADRLVVIDPSDVEFPAALNLFDAHLDRVKTYSGADRERVLNGVVELYELFFGSFLGAELTQKQGVVFKYLARLMLAVPDATIHTLMKIMEDGKPFKPYMDQLDGSARYFFETEFFHPSFAATKKQVLRRLWGVLSTPAFERMFTQPKNKLDLFEAMNEGKIILVNTAKDLLKREGSQLLGRFFVAMISQAALERSTIPERFRASSYVYIDEAQEYFDDSIETILNQARKYRVGLTLAHQTLDQLSPRLRSAIFANTSIKCVGGVSAKDARSLGDELRTTPEFIEGMKRRGARSEFAVWVKNLTGQAIRLSVPLGFLEREQQLSDEDYDALLAANRVRYCGTLADIPRLVPREVDAKATTFASPSESAQVETVKAKTSSMLDQFNVAPSPSGSRSSYPVSQAPVEQEQRRPLETGTERSEVKDIDPGKGGPKHRYLQALVKQLAEQQGLRATIEAPLSSGLGQVDVLIERDGVLAAIEISVSTPIEHEKLNLRKCLDAGYPRIGVVLAKSKRTQGTYQAGLSENLTHEERARVSFLAPEELPDFIAAVAPPVESTEKVVKGYRVKVSHTPGTPEEIKARQEAVARVIARSIDK